MTKKKQAQLRERLSDLKFRASELAAAAEDEQIKLAANLAEEAAGIGLELLEEEA